MKRLKQHKSGARLTLRGNDLLHVLMLPRSLKVQTVRMIVSTSGHLEFAEWISGDPVIYTHRELQLSLTYLEELKQAISSLAEAESKIAFATLEGDMADFEPVTRLFFKFWVEDNQLSTFRPSHVFYERYKIQPSEARKFETAFDNIATLLPFNFMTTSAS